MNPLDIGVVVVLALSAIFAFARGFVREALSIVAWVGAAAITWYGGDYVKHLLQGFVSDQLLAKLIALSGTFLVSLVILTIITSLIARLVHLTGLSGLDRTLGFAFGLFRGALILCLLYLLAIDYVFPPDHQPPWLKTAKSAPWLDEGAGKLRAFVPEQLKTKTAEATHDLLGTSAGAAAKEEAKAARDALLKPAAPTSPGVDSPPPANGYPAGDRRQLDRVINNQR